MSYQKDLRFMKLKIYGRNPVIEALRSDFSVQDLQIADSAQGKLIYHIKKFSEKNNVPFKIVPKNDLQKSVGAVVHQGVTSTVSDFSLMNTAAFDKFLSEKTNPAIIVLDQVQDPHNLGAVIRTAEVAGMDLIILPEKGSADINATVAKTSAGAMFHIPVFQAGDLSTVLETLHEHNIDTMAAVTGDVNSIYDVDMKKGTAIIIGSEGLGVRKNLAQSCRRRVTIPHSGKTHSLNASVAASVIIYEIVRQRNSGKHI